MKIPVFVSCPTTLNDDQATARSIILKQLTRNGLEPRALGRSDYPTEFPLREVAVIAKHCAGGVILGFSQLVVTRGVEKPGTVDEAAVLGKRHIPTPWNQLEAGILFGMGLPLLIFKQDGVSGGVFDNGVTDVFVHRMPSPAPDVVAQAGLREVFLKWQSKVRTHYYA